MGGSVGHTFAPGIHLYAGIHTFACIEQRLHSPNSLEHLLPSLASVYPLALFGHGSEWHSGLVLAQWVENSVAFAEVLATFSLHPAVS